ncbi:hypothetical protein LI174_07085, partial [[Clostridium] symbiosum]|nr:hypothetical protein [[Clostridium] symbiosum]
RKRFPKELFLPGFPTRDNRPPGTEDSQPPLTIPPPDLTAAFSFLNKIPYFPGIQVDQSRKMVYK